MSKFRRAIVSPILRGILGTICRIDCREYLQSLGGMEAMIIAINHINFLEVPVVVAFSHPRQVTGLVQAQAWKNPVMGFLFDSYDAIPINREGAYLQTFRKVHGMIREGFCVCIAPEGTRSKTGVLGRGKAGIVQLAYITGAPVLPVAHYGGENFWRDLKKFKRTPFQMKVGRPFRFKFEGKPSRDVQEAMLTELMGRIAALLPENMRGMYAEQALQESNYLEFI
ncbi:MAG: 1-acyl-sn-glycerol-3-phosphate acyltransferase [Treponema sp.]|jgi:1-acyl-sn-glycerol-3-phosphate acyltransferase|nr:1-acyl-sn-glycerol-3-phosphate acyltransferase [Treponema sp.]